MVTPPPIPPGRTPPAGFFAASTTLSETTTRIRIRYRPDLTVIDRINHGGTLYDIQAIINPKSGNRELVLMCKANG